MKIKDFIKEYNESNNKKKYIKSHITKSYISWATKVYEAEKIVSISCTSKQDNKFYLSSPMRYFLFVMSVINNYTDLEVEEKNNVDAYDSLEEFGLISEIIDTIGVDVKNFETVIKMTFDDYIVNFRNLTSYIDHKLDDFETLLDEIDVMQDTNVVKS